MLLVVISTFGKKIILLGLKKNKKKEKNKILHVLIFLIIGFYGGFIQIGFGLIMLSALTLMDDFDVLEANGLKNFITFIYTIPVFIIFLFQGLIFWKVALFLSLGQALGACLSGVFAIKSKNIERIISFCLIVMALATFIKFVIIN